MNEFLILCILVLLAHPAVDPSDVNNEALRMAVQFKRIDVVELLLQDSRVDPTAKNCEAVRVAKSKKLTAILNRLNQDPRVLNYTASTVPTSPIKSSISSEKPRTPRAIRRNVDL